MSAVGLCHATRKATMAIPTRHKISSSSTEGNAQFLNDEHPEHAKHSQYNAAETFKTQGAVRGTALITAMS